MATPVPVVRIVNSKRRVILVGLIVMLPFLCAAVVTFHALTQFGLITRDVSDLPEYAPYTGKTLYVTQERDCGAKGVPT